MKKFLLIIMSGFLLTTSTVDVAAANNDVSATSEDFIYYEYVEESYYAPAIRIEDNTLEFGKEIQVKRAKAGKIRNVYTVRLKQDGTLISRTKTDEIILIKAEPSETRVGIKIVIDDNKGNDGDSVVVFPDPPNNNQGSNNSGSGSNVESKPKPTPPPTQTKPDKPQQQPTKKPDKPVSTKPTNPSTDKVDSNTPSKELNDNNEVDKVDDELNNITPTPDVDINLDTDITEDESIIDNNQNTDFDKKESQITTFIKNVINFAKLNYLVILAFMAPFVIGILIYFIYKKFTENYYIYYEEVEDNSSDENDSTDLE